MPTKMKIIELDIVTRRPIDASIQRVYLLGFKELSFNILETRK